MVLDTIKSRDIVLHPDKIPPQIERWIVNEVIEFMQEEEWTADYYETLSNIALIDGRQMSRFYPKGTEHNITRARLLLKSGNFLIKTIHTRVCQDKKNKIRKLLWRCDCIPSQKTEVDSANVEKRSKQDRYTIFVCFEYNIMLTKNEYVVLPYPFSSSGCYDGRGFCSHMLCWSTEPKKRKSVKRNLKASFQNHPMNHKVNQF